MHCTYYEILGKRDNFSDPTPGDLIACVSFVQLVLPIALARPFVEQFVPDGTRVSATVVYSSGILPFQTYLYNYTIPA